MTIDINELRRLAQAATPGPWKVGQYLGSQRQFVIHMDVGDKGRGTDIAFTTASFGGSETIANARIIAAANPGVVLELLDEIERLREINAGLSRHSNGLVEDKRKLRAEIEAMRAQLIEDAEKRRLPTSHEKAVEDVTRAILFEDCSNTDGWEYNTDLGDAAIRAYRPYVQVWRNDALEAAAGIADEYGCKDAARDIRAMIAPGAQTAPRVPKSRDGCDTLPDDYETGDY